MDINNEEQNEIEIDLRELFFHIKRYWYIVVVSILVGVLGAAFYLWKIEVPQYQATAMIYMRDSNTQISVSDLQVNQELSSDYMVILKSRPVLNRIISDLDVDMTYDQLYNSTTISTIDDTRIIKITVTNTNAQIAADLANQLVDRGVDTVEEIESKQPYTVEKAVVDNNKINTSNKKVLLMGMLLGLVASIGGLFIQFMLNDKVRSADDIEKTVYAYVQSQIDEYGLDAQIVDVVVAGTLETYLPEVETYLQEKVQQEQINNQLVTKGREAVQEQQDKHELVSDEKELSELGKEPVIEPETVHITFTVAECGEFHTMGEFHEGIETIEEAMKLYNAINPSHMHGIPSIGVNMHIDGTEEWEDEEADIVRENCIDMDFLNYTPELRDNPTVQDALKKLIAAYPDKEVNERETKEMKIQTLAAELDQLSYDIDTFEYRDSVPDREAQVQMIANDIRSGNVKPLQIFLQTSIDEGIDADSERQAKELLAKLAEYKPLAKIEEIEEQNYNMIDDRLNNGVEKFNREEEKKEQQEKPQARSSLKERLAAKQKEVAQGKNKDSKEQDKTKKTNREEI